MHLIADVGSNTRPGKDYRVREVKAGASLRARFDEMCSWGVSALRCCTWMARGKGTRSYTVDPASRRLFPSALLWAFVAAVCTATSPQAADLGTHGPLYEVEEPSLLETIYARLEEMETSGELDEMKRAQQQRTRDYVKRPKPVSGLIRAVEPAEWDVDLSITLAEDIADHRGVVFARAGTVVNPLAFSSFDKRIVLFDGDDEDQLEYALSEGDELDTLLVLVNGDPLSLMRKYGRRFYFDQQSVLTDRFGVRHVPAEITRGVHVMRVREIVLGGQP